MINISSIPGIESLTSHQRAVVIDMTDDGQHIDPARLNLDVVAHYRKIGQIEVHDLGGGKVLIHYLDHMSSDPHTMEIVDDWREAAMDWLAGWDCQYYDDLDQWFIDWGIPAIEIVEATPNSPGPFRLWIQYFYQVDHFGAPRDTWLDIEPDDEICVDPHIDREFVHQVTYESYDEAVAARDILDARIYESRLDGDMERMAYGEYDSPRVIIRSLSK